MIEVKFYPRKAKLTVSGHAPKEPNRDYSLVCAAATQNLRLFEHAISSFAAHDALIVKKSLVSSGYAEISYLPSANYAMNVALGMILDGFRMLSVSYPEQISYEISEESEVKTE